MRKDKRERINNIIRERYPKSRNDESLAKSLGLSLNALRLRASKLCIKKENKVNRIREDNKKKCSRCKKYKDISEFRRDKSSAKDCKYDYYCKKCRAELYSEIKEKEIVIIGSLAFGKGKKRNESFVIDGIEYLKCKECGEVKEINEGFALDMKNKSHQHKNYCRICLKERRKKTKCIITS